MVTLKEYLNSDRIDYFPFGSKGYIMDWLLRTEQYWIRRYIRALRKEEFYMNYKRNKILQYYFSRKKNVDIGQNAQILGGIYIADGVKIGAGAVVTKSVLVPGVTVVGVPARIVEK